MKQPRAVYLVKITMRNGDRRYLAVDWEGRITLMKTTGAATQTGYRGLAEVLSNYFYEFRWSEEYELREVVHIMKRAPRKS